MDENAQNQQNSKLSAMKKWIIALGILLLLSLAFMIVFIVRGGRLNNENQNLQEQKTTLTEEKQELQNQKKTVQEKVSVLENDMDTLRSDFEKQLTSKEAQISSLQNKSREMDQLKSRIAEYKEMEGQFEDLKTEHSILQEDADSLKDKTEKLSEEMKLLNDSINRSRGLQAYNISPLTKWERWLWADRYNISRARRVDETTITFEIGGTPFAESGSKMVYLRMINPGGDVMYPSEETFVIDETETQTSFTKAKEIEYTGEDVPMTFNVEHDNGLEPGNYEIEIYIDGKLTKSGQMKLE